MNLQDEINNSSTKRATFLNEQREKVAGLARVQLEQTNFTLNYKNIFNNGLKQIRCY